MNKKIIVVFLIALSGYVCAQIKDYSEKAREIVKQMTLEEKARMVVGMGMKFPGMPAPAVGDTEDKVPGAAGTTFSLKRFNIPTAVYADGPAGVRISPVRNNDSSKTYYATGFPVATLLASSWDTSLVEKIGAAFGNELLEYGVDVLLAPGMNIHRNPLGGRNFEYYSEDPVVTGNMAAAMVKGVQSKGVGTSIKHFAANNQESNRMEVNTIVSQRALREIYLKGFEIAVKKSQPWTVMSSYNKINGTYTSESNELLTKILRDEWGFKGFVMTDWFGGKDIIAQMKAGNDLIMPGRPEQVQEIIEAVKSGKLDEAVVSLNAERIIAVLLQGPAYKNYNYSNKPDLINNAKIAREAAAEGMVLLKNEKQVLPIAAGKTIALFGNASYETIAGGTGSGDVNKAYIVSLYEGLKNAGFKPVEAIRTEYTDYIAREKAAQPKGNPFMPKPPVPAMPLDESLINKMAADCDAAILTIGRNSGEFSDRKLENDFYLSAAEKEQIINISKAFHEQNKKLIIILNIGGVIETATWRDFADAILLAWQPGQEGGNAIADILSGKINPSGKLATTFPVDYQDVPSANTFPGTPADKPMEVIYEEGIFNGYRYYNTFNVKPAYEFGYGLSYTTFQYSDIKTSTTVFSNNIKVTVKVTNTGDSAGREAVQLYISAPAGKLEKPSEELKAFAKTKVLNPDESQELTFELTANDLASFDSETSAWICEPGKYTVKLGASSLNIKQNAEFIVNDLIKTEITHNLLAPEVPINEMKK